MAISKDTPLGLAYIIVIIALILPQTAAHIVSIQESVVGNVKGFCEKSLQSLYFLPFQIFCNCQNYDTQIRVASVVVYVGSANFHFQARTSVNIIVKIADDASEIVHNATRVLGDIEKNLESSITADVFTKLNSTANRMDDAVDDVVEKTWTRRHTVNKAFKVVFSDDTCTVLESFKENPYNNTLSSTIPCAKLLSAKTFLQKIAAAISYVVHEVNKNAGTLLPKGVYLCDPFSAAPEYSYQPEMCKPNTIKIADIPEVLKHYTCFNDDNEKCGSSKVFINAGEYHLVETYTNLVQSILNMYPGMEQLIECQLVKEAFSQIILKHCKPLKKFSRMTWIGVMLLAVVMVFFVVLWTIRACQDHSHEPSDCSV
ncbi:hypothetical protein ACSQ67_022386 [Phaseolus vulgaris]